MAILLKTSGNHRGNLLVSASQRSLISNHVVGTSLPTRASFQFSALESKALGTHLAPHASTTLGLTSRERHLSDLGAMRFVDTVHHVHSSMDSSRKGQGCSTQIEKFCEQWDKPWIEQLDRAKSYNIAGAGPQEDVRNLISARDPRMWPYAGSMVVVGLGAGVVMPALPLLAVDLGVTQGQFGYITSAFGLAKLISNTPSGAYAEKYGRQTTLVAGSLLFGIGYVALAFATSLEHMMLARFVMGGGAAFTMAGATMAVADISNPGNRARMMGPVVTAFSAGAVLGPFIGSGLIDSVGFQNCALVVSGLLLVNAFGARLLTSETMPQMSTNNQKTLIDVIRETTLKWAPMCRDERLRPLVLMNAAYRFALAGGMLTVLPLMLTQQFGCGASEIGMLFGMQSMVSVVSSESLTRLADHYGPHRLLAPALATMAMSFLTVPMATDVWQTLPPLIAMALSNTVLLTAPTAAMANAASSSEQAQSLSLLRTAGDAGLLFGGVFVGTAAGFLGFDFGLQGTSVFLMASAIWFATRGLQMRLS